MGSPINESYLIKEIQIHQAARFGTVMRAMGDNRVPNDHDYEQYVDSLVTSLWRKDDEKIYFYRDKHDHRHTSGVYFSAPFYDPDRSKIHYGKSKITVDVEANDKEQTKIFDNRDGVGLVEVKFSQEIALNNTVEHSFASEMTFDTTIASETTVSGSYGGVSAEEKVTATFGFEDKQSEAETESESKTATDTIEVVFEVEENSCILLEVNKQHQRISTPFDVNGILDSSIDLDFSNWSSGEDHGRYRGKRTEFHFESLDQFFQWTRGYDTQYPESQGFWEHAYGTSRAAINAILDPETRRVQLSGTKLRTLEQNATYRITDLGNNLPPEFSGDHIVDVNGDDFIDNYQYKHRQVA